MIKVLYFSPTGSSKKVGLAAAGAEYREISWSLPSERQVPVPIEKEDVLIFSFPVYFGRVPELLLEPMRRLEGKGAKALIFGVYGNRAYEDALREASDILRDQGFQIIGAGAVVAEHSYSSLVASGEPCEKVLEDVALYAQKRINLCKEVDNLPGNKPYRPYFEGEAPKRVPPITEEGCIFCHLCVECCPVNAIEEDCITIDEGCILCNNCVKICPTKAKIQVDPRVIFFRGFLEKNFPVGKQPEFFQ